MGGLKSVSPARNLRSLHLLVSCPAPDLQATMQAAQLQARATRPAVARRTTVRVQAQQAAPRAQASDRGR